MQGGHLAVGGYLLRPCRGISRWGRRDEEPLAVETACLLIEASTVLDPLRRILARL